MNVPRKSAGEKKVLRHEIKTRVNNQKFTELRNMLPKTRCKTMSELVRNILHNKPIKVYTVDESFPKLMEEISGIRKELNAIGININQVTRQFNNSSDREQRFFHAFEIDKHYRDVGKKVAALLIIISKLSDKWLQE